MRLDLRRKRGLCALLLMLFCGSSVGLDQQLGPQDRRSVQQSASELKLCLRDTHPFASWLHRSAQSLDVRTYGEANSYLRSYEHSRNQRIRELRTASAGSQVQDVQDGQASSKVNNNDNPNSSDSTSTSKRKKIRSTGEIPQSLADVPSAKRDDRDTTSANSRMTGGMPEVRHTPIIPSESSRSPTMSTFSESNQVPSPLPQQLEEPSQENVVVTKAESRLDAKSIYVDASASGSDGTTVTSDAGQKFPQVVTPARIEETKQAVQEDGDVAQRGDQKSEAASPNATDGPQLPLVEMETDTSTAGTAANEDGLKQNDTENATSILNDSIIDGKEAMPSFDEWKKIRLEQEQLQEIPSQTKIKEPEQREIIKPIERKRGRRNYASVECGAKLLSANPGAESASKILLESKDEYMLNPCNSLQKEGMWFTVELCESIHPTHLELANFELYSSTGKAFVVYMGDPDESRDWTRIGKFEMAQLKTVQSFPLDAPGFGKAIKVEFQSIYENNQYYCPLSLVRVFGSSMVDDYEEKVSEDITAQLEQKQPKASKEQAAELPVATPGGVGRNVGSGENMVSRAKQAVINIISSVSQAVSGSSSTRSAANSNGTDCPDTGSKVADNERKSPSTVASEFDGCIELTNFSGSDGLLWPSMKCHRKPFIKELERSCSYQDPEGLADLMATDTPPISHPPLQTKSMTPASAFITSTVADIAPTRTTKPTKDVKTQILVSIIPPDLNKKQAEQKGKPQQHNKLAQQKQQHQPNEQQDDQQTKKKIVEAGTDSKAPVQPSTQNTLIEDKEKRAERGPETTESTTITPKASVKLPPQQQQQLHNIVLSSQPVIPLTKPHGQIGNGLATPTKENLFSRFESRIKQLELNTNLSSDYLQELSQRYRKQMEEMQTAFNKTVAVLNAEAKKAAERDQNQQVALAALQERLTSAMETLRMLEVERDSLWWRLLLVYCALLVASVAILIVILHIVPRRAIASFMSSDLLERRIRDVVTAREREVRVERTNQRISTQKKDAEIEAISSNKEQPVLKSKEKRDQLSLAEINMAANSLRNDPVDYSKPKLEQKDFSAQVYPVKMNEPEEQSRTSAGPLLREESQTIFKQKRRRRHRGKSSSNSCTASHDQHEQMRIHGSTVKSTSSTSDSKPFPLTQTQNLFGVLVRHNEESLGALTSPTRPSSSSCSVGHRKQIRRQHHVTTRITLQTAAAEAAAGSTNDVSAAHERGHELSTALTPLMARSL
ncbi:SUN domain-containing ossification factor-like isoform X3 [Varroa jacobsoni]|uniref:SUN domain-containing ossification factor-like isoform X3 n=1 Tax=Varroa jacobsoni TaxID=62625 RepID=UPI000BF6994D|nr:SUN domain-containing ossification factor-like isoform X3 [Varroa jacobsoni]